jgi:NADH-quinone oxidoreductase subunit L
MNDPLPCLILFVPLLAAVLITLFLQRNPRLSAGVSAGAVLISFILSLDLLVEFQTGANPSWKVNWLQVGKLTVDFSLRFDSMSILMLLIVTGVGLAIHLYSVGYMHGDPGFSRYFAFLSLFTFSMLGIVMSGNFFQMFIFWELVGVCSYLLIGFWYERPAAADAAKKAFLTNRVGDFGFFTGIILVWSIAGTMDFNGIKDQLLRDPELFDTATALVGFLIFCGAVGKSAQFPLHVWLPDAMEGPTPVSALIHAATMVAAGVYMLSRVFFIFNPFMLHVIAWIGGLTALMAALIAVQQDDIKRILAYSTLSQLGYMVMAVGLADPAAGMFHLATHAAFKALLFLAAGAIIHAMSHEQNIWNMGGLRKRIPLTYRTFLVGTLSLCGVPPFSGFYSKDAILATAWEHNKMLFGIGAVVAFLTTFYMFRLVFVVFFGKPTQDNTAYTLHPRKSRLIAYPLVVLAVLTVMAGFIGIEQFLARHFAPGEEMAPLFAPFAPFQRAAVPAVIGLAAFAFGIMSAYFIYANATSDPLAVKFAGISEVLRRKFYFDEFYTELIAISQEALASFANSFDGFIKLIIRGMHASTELSGRALRLAQTGNLQTYALLFAAGIAVVLYFMLLR